MTRPAPFFADAASAPEGVQAYWIRAADGVRVRVAAWSGGDGGTVFIFPGRTEYAEKYGRVVSELVQRNLAVVVIDWRGQGLSDRFPNAPLLGHVDDFQAYQYDVQAALEVASGLELPHPRYMLAHSMGGCIGTRTLKESGGFRAAIMTAPMWSLNMARIPQHFARQFTLVASAFGFGGRLTPGTKAKSTYAEVGFDGNALTSDRANYEWAASQIAAHPELSVGGASIQWTRAALTEMARLDPAPLRGLPLLVFLGTEESVVSAEMIRARVSDLPLGRLVECQNGRHEILMENQGIQDLVWSEIDTFLGTRTPETGNEIRSA